MIRIASVEKESIVDGEGIRYVIFTQGCTHNCAGCHNPKTHDFSGGYDVDDIEIYNDIIENPLLDGITLSGGDPLFQADKLIKLVDMLKKDGYTIWVYTGFVFDEFLKYINNEPCDKRITKDMINMLKYADVVVDGPFILEKRTLDALYRGSTNQRLIDVTKTFANNEIIEYIPD